jgi:hypothetical protein
VSTGLEQVETPQGEHAFIVDPGLEDLLRSRRLFANVRWQDYTPDGQADREDVDELSIAEAASSQLALDTEKHAIMFDIDVPATLDGQWFKAQVGDDVFVWSTQGMPAWLIPSSTEGHSHLYVQCNLPWEVVSRILRQFTEAGVVERGYRQVSEKRGFTALRLPWIRKEVVADAF